MAAVPMAGAVPMDSLCGDRVRLSTCDCGDVAGLDVFLSGDVGLVVFFNGRDVPCRGTGARGGSVVTFFLFSLLFFLSLLSLLF